MPTREDAIRERELRAEAAQLAKDLSRYVNSFEDKKLHLLAEEIRHDHRTLQQSTFRFMLILMSQWAKDYENERYDDRNYHAVRTCYELMQKLDKEVPFI